MRALEVYRNGILAGSLEEIGRENYVFQYDATYYSDTKQPSISLTLPKTQIQYSSKYLFPFFFNMLSEGVNRQLQCRFLKIDEADDFGLLMKTAQHDSIGAVQVKPQH